MSQWRDIFGIKIKKPNFLAHLKSINLNSLDKILFAVLRLSLLVLALVFILMIASWVIEEDSSIVLVPFDTAGLSGNLNGNSMSNFLQYEIQTIKDITRLDDRRSPKFITGPLKVVSKSGYNINYTLNNVGLSIDMPKMEFYIKDIDKDLDESLSDIGTINVEGTSFSIGKMLLSMKELAGHKARTISCSIQNYGSTVSVTAIFHDGKSEGEVYVWEAKRHLMEPNQTVNDQIPSLIEDLAFQITYNLGKIGSSKPETYPRNWTTFKDLVLAREAYETYSVNEKIIYLDKASNLVLQANESEPDYKGSIRQSILYDLGFAYLNEGKYNESGRLFRSLFAIEPEIGYFGLGLVYYKNNNYEKALSYINRVTVMNPKNAYAWLIKGIILNSEKNYADAQESLNKSNELNSNIEWALFFKGINSFQQNNMKEALNSFDLCIDLNSNNSWALFSKGRIIRDENPEEALGLFNKTIELDPENAYAWNERGNCLYLMRNFKEALESNNVALELSPNSWNIWWDRGLILMGNESYEEAIKCIDKASNLCPQDPQNAEKWNNLGVYLAKIREGGNSLDLSHEAIKAYDKAIDLNPQLAEAWYSKSQVLEALGRTSEAEAAYAEAKDLGYAGCPPAFSRES